MPDGSRLTQIAQTEALICSTDKPPQRVLCLDAGGLKAALEAAGCPVWVDLPSTDEALLKVAQQVFNLHPLAVEDCLHVGHRAVLDRYPEHLFFLMLTLRPEDPTSLEDPHELEIFLGPDYILTIHTEPVAAIDSLRERLGQQPHPLAKGPDGLMHLIIDHAVDLYFIGTEHLEDRLDELQERAFDPEDRRVLPLLFGLRKQAVQLRRHAAPLLDAVRPLAAGEHPFVRDETALHFRDVYDHVMRVNERLEMCRDLVTSCIDSHYSVVSSRANDIMKVLSVVATITLPVMFITSFFGMNLEHMVRYLRGPEAFWGATAIMGATTIGTLLWLKRRKWT